MNVKFYKTLIVRYIKFNLTGSMIFPFTTLLYFLCTNLGWLSWFIANFTGGMIHFLVIRWMNKRKKGLMFEAARV